MFHCECSLYDIISTMENYSSLHSKNEVYFDVTFSNMLGPIFVKLYQD